jgi:hypothetical protein
MPHKQPPQESSRAWDKCGEQMNPTGKVKSMGIKAGFRVFRCHECNQTVVS